VEINGGCRSTANSGILSVDVIKMMLLGYLQGETSPSLKALLEEGGIFVWLL
jgi:hypothetical protein